MQDKGNPYSCTAQKLKFSIKDMFSKCDQIRRFLGPNLQESSDLVIFTEESLLKNFIFCAEWHILRSAYKLLFLM